jgi:hypothetical protein
MKSHYRRWVKLCSVLLMPAVIALVAATPAAARPNEKVSGTKKVVVLSTVGWQSTGIVVKRGHRYGVWQTSGSWNADYRNFDYVDGAGYSPHADAEIYQGCKYVSTWPYGLLIGRVGDDIFPIGRGYSFQPHENGVLELSIHDDARCVGDNAGALHVKVDEGLGSADVLKRLTPWLFDRFDVRKDIEYVINQLKNLTPDENGRIAALIGSMRDCAYSKIAFNFGLWKLVLPLGCAKVLLSMFSFIINPQKIE